MRAFRVEIDFADDVLIERLRAVEGLVSFAFGSIGQLLAASRPRIAVVALSVVAVCIYIVQRFAPLFSWPDWSANFWLSSLYRTPLSGEISWAGVAALVGIAAGAMVGSMAALRWRDVSA